LEQSMGATLTVRELGVPIVSYIPHELDCAMVHVA
jgi:hypothetical protein